MNVILPWKSVGNSCYCLKLSNFCVLIKSFVQSLKGNAEKVVGPTHFAKSECYFLTVARKSILCCKVPNCWILVLVTFFFFFPQFVSDLWILIKSIEFCTIMKFLFLQKKNPKEIHECECMLQTLNDKRSLYSTMKKWCANFQCEGLHQYQLLKLLNLVNNFVWSTRICWD